MPNRKPPFIEFPIASSDVETLAACPVCAGSSLEKIAEVAVDGEVTFLTTAVCRTCGFIFRRSRPTPAWFEQMWKLREESQRDFGGSPFNPDIETHRYRRYQATAAVLTRHGCGPRIIDVGCGPATGLRAFLDAGFKPTGLEPDRTRARFVDVPGVLIVETTVEQFAATSQEPFDSVTCQHSLEHFHQPAKVLTAIASLLADHGLVFLEVPDWRHSVHDWHDALYVAHLSNFIARSLMLLASSVGLTVIDRTFPQGDGPGESHLALVLRKDAVVTQELPMLPVSFVDEVREVYRRGLPNDGVAQRASEPVRLSIPYINDLSLAFKGDPTRVHSQVRQNFAHRTLAFDAASGVYRVDH
ncbi:MAG: hypothetical protein C0483_18810 [Pirellula sp.]|nr:hypothetical protein [Pirellula sp.]